MENKFDFEKIQKLWGENEALAIYMIIDKLNDLDEEQKKTNVYIKSISAWSLVGRQILITIPVVVGVIGLFFAIFKGVF